MDQPYSKREQDHFFSDLFKRMESQDTVLARIEKQTTTTNGRVTRIEDWSAGAKVLIESTAKTTFQTDLNYQKAKVRIVTIITCITLLLATIIGLAVKVANDRIDRGIKEGFSAIERKYNINVDN